ncbi:lipid-binding protein [uncultured Bacteroides sp.]|uniref:lipid-binding protein n=1 Tax=uncultured Bacteroides sp. TaxID=162156 RepID=UPI002AABE31D|nr:lipid-binding protein [uncultured Bacteroides sp.]
MKKYFIFLLTALVITFVACDDDTEPGGTSVEKMAGDWWVTVNVINGGQDLGDAGVGHIRMSTYNTAMNTATEMWIDDAKHFWDYKLKVDVDYATRTFSTTDFVSNVSYNSKVKITNGKILEGAALTPSGMPADSIVYMVQFDDDSDGYTYKVSGFRRTGLPADDF